MAGCQIIEPRRGMGKVQGAVTRGFAGDILARNQIKDTGRGRAKRINQRFTRFDAEGFNYLLRRQPQACVHKAHIAPRSAMADLLRL